MVKYRKYTGLLLILVYAFFFASTNLFYHSHQMADHILVHSHPFSIPGHSHTAGQVLLIDLIDSADFLESSELSVPDAIPAFHVTEIYGNRVDDVLSANNFSYSLRAPPASCLFSSVAYHYGQREIGAATGVSEGTVSRET